MSVTPEPGEPVTEDAAPAPAEAPEDALVEDLDPEAMEAVPCAFMVL